MLTKLQECVELGEKLGAEFVEARFDDLILRTLKRINDAWKDIILTSRAGIGVACYYGGASGYSFTPSDNKKELEETVSRAFKMAKASSNAVSLKLDFDSRSAVKSRAADTFPVKIHPKSKDLDYKTDLVNRVIDDARESGENVSNVTGAYGELYGRKLFTNSEGSIVDWSFEVVELRCSVISKTESGDLVTGFEQAGGTMGLELFNTKGSTPEDIRKRSRHSCKGTTESKNLSGWQVPIAHRE